jgi:hypothetical protein
MVYQLSYNDKLVWVGDISELSLFPSYQYILWSINKATFTRCDSLCMIRFLAYVIE